MPKVTTQDPASEQYGGQSGGIVRRRSSRKTAALPGAPPPMPIHLQPSDLNELQQSQVYTQTDGYLGGAGQSHANLRSTPSDRSASRRGVSGGKDSRGPPVRGDDTGGSRPGARPNDPIPSRMLLVLTLVYLYLTQFRNRCHHRQITPPRTLYPPETFQSAGRLGPDRNVVGDTFYQSGPSRNPSRAFSRLRVF